MAWELSAHVPMALAIQDARVSCAAWSRGYKRPRAAVCEESEGGVGAAMGISRKTYDDFVISNVVHVAFSVILVAVSGCRRPAVVWLPG